MKAELDVLKISDEKLDAATGGAVTVTGIEHNTVCGPIDMRDSVIIGDDGNDYLSIKCSVCAPTVFS